jgi:hypothetical protein
LPAAFIRSSVAAVLWGEGWADARMNVIPANAMSDRAIVLTSSEPGRRGLDSTQPVARRQQSLASRRPLTGAGACEYMMDAQLVNREFAP